jgi:hypothetical protein
MFGRENRNEGALGEGAVTDLAAAGGADEAARFTDGERTGSCSGE